MIDTMLLSYNWLKEFVDFDYTPEELDDVLTMLGIEVEGIIDYKQKYKGFYTGKVLSCEKHPNADKLSVCEVDYGKGKTTVVCGGPNVASGQMVVLGLSGAVVPNGGFELGRRKIRGIESDGMICSEIELEVGDDASGILVLPEGTRPGLQFDEYLNLDDIIYDVSLTPNRADCLSHFGVARDVAAYMNVTAYVNVSSDTNITVNKNIKARKPALNLNETGGDVSGSIEVIIEDKEKCPRYTARVVRNATVGESPDWLKRRLTMLGLRPINSVVDVTNLVLMETGQPLHAFDLDKVAGNKIIVKTVLNKDNKGVEFTTLDGKSRTLDDQMLMICDGEKPVAVAGVMGGGNSEISLDTQDILIESAYFHPSSIRRTSKKLGIQSDSSYRFERGVDINNVVYANDRAAQLIAELTGGIIEKGIVDCYPDKIPNATAKFRYGRARKIIGLDIENEKMKQMLESLNMKILSQSDNELLIEVPSYRVDITSEIDLIEEIVRLNNYNNLTPDYSSCVNFGTQPISAHLRVPELRAKIRDFLINRGYREILTQNMLDPDSAAIYTDDPVVLSNPLGEELSIMRPSLIPAMLRTIERNRRYGNQDLRLYEIGKTFSKEYDAGSDLTEGIHEQEELIIGICGKGLPKQWSANDADSDFYDIKGIFEELTSVLRIDGLKLKGSSGDDSSFGKNSLTVFLGKREIGRIGEISTKLTEKFNVGIPVFVLNICLTPIYQTPTKPSKYTKVSSFPGISRDLAFVFGREVQAEKVKNEITQLGGKYLKQVSIFDIYSGKNIGADKKSIAFNLTFSASGRTLADEDVEKPIRKIIAAVEKKFDSNLRDS